MKISGDIFSYFNTQRANARQETSVQKTQVTNPFSNFLNGPSFDTFEKTSPPEETPLARQLVQQAARQVEFTGHKCSTDEFKIKQLYGLPCPCCGKTMLHNNQINNFSRSVSKKSGEELIKELDKYSEYYRPVEKEAVEMIKQTAKENPTASFEEIIKINAENVKENLENEQIKVLNDLRKAGDLYTQKSQEKAYTDFIDSSIELIKSRDNRFFKRKTFIREYLELASAKGIPSGKRRTFKEIKRKVYKLPNSESSVNAFFAKYSRRTPYETAQRLLKPAGVTAEHIKPQSKGGEDNTANYLCECNDCNSRRGNATFLNWASNKANFGMNLQRYLNKTAQELEEKNFEEYSTYIDDVINTIVRETRGTITPTKPKILPKTAHAPQKVEKQPTPEELRAKYEERIQNLTSETEKRQAEIKNLLRRKEELKGDKEYESYLRYLNLQNSCNQKKNALNEAVQRLQTFRKQIYKKERQKDKTKPKQNRIPTPKELELLEEYKQATKVAREDLQKENDKLKAHLETFETPEDLEAKLRILREKLKKITAQQEKISETANKLADAKKMEEDYERLLENMESEKEALAKAELTIDFSSPESKAAAKAYSAVISKLDVLDTINPSVFRQFYKETGELSQDFIITEARKSLEAQRQELLSSKTAQCVQKRFEIEKSKQKAQDLKAKIDTEIQAEQELKELQRKLDEFLGTETVEEVEKQYQEVQAKIQRYKEYEDMLNIVKILQNLQRIIDDNTKELKETLNRINKLK